MSTDPQDSVFLVTSSDPDNRGFGTAFAFCSVEDAQYTTREASGLGLTFERNNLDSGTYLLTCRHVVARVGGNDHVRIGDYSAKVVASGSEHGPYDLAVLHVDNLYHVPILRFNPLTEKGSSVRIWGFHPLDQNFLIRPLKAQLGERVGFQTRGKSERVPAWDLAIKDDYDLERGYSGGPVIDKNRGRVVAVANFREGGSKV